MFLNLLNDTQKRAFLAMATKVVMADGGVMPEEDVTLAIRRAEMGGGVTAPPDQIFGPSDTDVFDSRRSQTIALIELYVLAYSDAKFHPDERPILDDLRKTWGFGDDEVADIEAWAQRQAPLSVEAWTLIEKLSPA